MTCRPIFFYLFSRNHLLHHSDAMAATRCLLVLALFSFLSPWTARITGPLSNTGFRGASSPFKSTESCRRSMALTAPVLSYAAGVFDVHLRIAYSVSVQGKTHTSTRNQHSHHVIHRNKHTYPFQSLIRSHLIFSHLTPSHKTVIK